MKFLSSLGGSFKGWWGLGAFMHKRLSVAGYSHLSVEFLCDSVFYSERILCWFFLTKDATALNYEHNKGSLKISTI